MSNIDATIEDFGNSMGMSQLSFGDKNFIHLSIENTGELFLERDNEHLIVYLVRTLDFPSLKHFAQALELSHFTFPEPLAITPGLHQDNQLAFITHFNEETATLPNIHTAINILKKAQDRIATIS